ncbi:hypothetical protein [Lewinella sp. IMCC34183]|uniref:hypothetical protein n=1 Tax=Lewinella sp. IMCC34183 TaxID=2248762 RepID=UPI000E23274E|nr:hypothetical protein [Lewinella sp. IMCC34183]
MLLDDANPPSAPKSPWHYVTPFTIAGVLSFGFSVYLGWFEFSVARPSPQGMGALIGILAGTFALLALAVDRLLITCVDLRYIWLLESLALVLLYQYVVGW